jgi:RNA polymerase sigma-70 factor, ECF subfamily
VTDEAAYPCDTLTQARLGSAAGFTALVRTHQRTVYSVALRMLSDPHQAEDLAQEVFIRLHANLAQLHSELHLIFWLRQVTTRLAIDRLRQERRHQLVALAGDAPQAEDAPSGDPMLQRQLRALLEELSPSARAVVVLRYQEDMDPLDIAQVLEIPLNTVKSHLKRSLASLREKLSGDTTGSPSPTDVAPG